MLEWLQPGWETINQARVQMRLPHALLITGASGIGKKQLADKLAAVLLCEHPDEDGHVCGQCMGCAWIKNRNHPDVTCLEPEEEGKAIKVDQIRSMCAGLAMTSHAGCYKVVIISPADAMNVNASNSLLKSLEEPTDNTLLILLSASPGRLPATIRSRCQKISIALPSLQQSEQWLQSQGMTAEHAVLSLQLSRGAPLTALKLSTDDSSERRRLRLDQLHDLFIGKLDPVVTAEDWAKNNEKQSLDWWRGWIQSIIRWQQAKLVPVEPDVTQKLQQIAETVDCSRLYRLLDQISEAINMLGSGLGKQLLLEDLLISWARLAESNKPVLKNG